MRSQIIRLMIGFLCFLFLGIWLSCATDQAHLRVANSLPQSEIAYYNDTFDKLREDLWDRAGYINKEEQMQNFKQADMRFEGGKLAIRTKTGGFSKGGLGSSFSFRGDFDIQLDCRMDFLKGVSGMDHLLNIAVIETNKEIGEADIVVILLFLGEGGYQGWINSRALINGLWNNATKKALDNFDGSLRFVRTGKKITSLYKIKGATAWNKIKTFHVTGHDMMVGFTLRNYFNRRTSIWALRSITAEFDNFKINAAHEIIEGEI